MEWKSYDFQNIRPGHILVPKYSVIGEFFFIFFRLVCHSVGKLFAMYPSASWGGLGRFPVRRNTHRRGAMAAATCVCLILKLNIPVRLSQVPDAGLGNYRHRSLNTAGISRSRKYYCPDYSVTGTEALGGVVVGAGSHS